MREEFAVPQGARRSRNRRLVRGLVAAGTSCVALVLPLAVATSAHAAPSVSVSTKAYSNNLDGWIRHSLSVMAAHHIPGTYNGIRRNVMRESSGNPYAINLWDSNAAAGTPSKGLLQLIDPTFRRYHVSGTSWNIYNPVANITAACKYAAARYGSIDRVHGAY